MMTITFIMIKEFKPIRELTVCKLFAVHSVHHFDLVQQRKV